MDKEESKQMRLLIIEDNETFLGEMQAALGGIQNRDLEVAASSQTAVEKLRAQDFDLISCDLKIPTQDGALGAHGDHGCVVYRFFFFSSRRRHTILVSDWSSDVCSSDLPPGRVRYGVGNRRGVGAAGELQGRQHAAARPEWCVDAHHSGRAPSATDRYVWSS